jgi:hypothetical protein
MILFVTMLFLIASYSVLGQQYDDENDFLVEHFENINSVIILRFPPTIRNIPVTGFGVNVLSNRKVTTIILPNSLQNAPFSWDSFANNDLTSISIPNGVTYIASRAFFGNKLTSVNFPEGMWEIGSEAFASNNLTSVSIPDSVTTIGSGAFSRNNITRITIGANVKFNYYDGPRVIRIFDIDDFDLFYTAQGRKAGVYTYSNNRWNVQFR